MLGAIAVFASTTNIVSGFLITDRMLKMFKKRARRQAQGGRTMIDQLIQLVYLVATALFIFSLKWMSDPATARRGVFAGVGGMALAIIGTLLHPLIIGYSWIAIPLVLGALAGVPLSWVPLTAVPQRTALSHAFGGLAAGLVGTAKYFLWAEHDQLTTFRMGAIARRSDPRLSDLHRKPGRRGQAAGSDSDAADHVSRPERHQLRAARARPSPSRSC